MENTLNRLGHTMGDIDNQKVMVINFQGGLGVGDTYYGNNNSVTIGDGNTISEVQFAQGSTNFKGSISSGVVESDTLEAITEKLIQALLNETELQSTRKDELIDAINQVSVETRKEKPNKLSLSGLASGIHIVMGELAGISTATLEIYNSWSELVTSLFN